VKRVMLSRFARFQEYVRGVLGTERTMRAARRLEPDAVLSHADVAEKGIVINRNTRTPMPIYKVPHHEGMPLQESKCCRKGAHGAEVTGG